MEFVTEIYSVTQQFPKAEVYGLTSQIRRAAISIPSNIAEGCARFSDKETLKFLSIAIGSAVELETQLIIAKNIQYVDNIDELISKLETIKKLIMGLTKYLNNKNNSSIEP